MKLYELTYLISPDLSEEELKTSSQKIAAFLQEEGGSLNKTENLIQKRLGYPLKNKSAAYLVTLNFQLNSEKLMNLEKKLKAESRILRYIILTKKVPELIEMPRKIRTLPSARTLISPKLKPPSKPPIEIKKPKREKVELKEIEKKLEEILRE